MSKITPDDVRKIALLSRLSLDEAEIAKFTGQLEAVLEYVDLLTEADVEGVEPFISAGAAGNVLRADEVRDSLPTEQALANAPRSGAGFFEVPAVVK